MRLLGRDVSVDAIHLPEQWTSMPEDRARHRASIAPGRLDIRADTAIAARFHAEESVRSVAGGRCA